MAAIQVYGMNPLEGEISVQGSKNGALPIMAGALLHKGTTVLYNVPDIEDTRCMTDILREIGCRCEKTGSRLVIDAAFVDRTALREIIHWDSHRCQAGIRLPSGSASPTYSNTGVPASRK